MECRGALRWTEDANQRARGVRAGDVTGFSLLARPVEREGGGK